jgi:hypothetical protein
MIVSTTIGGVLMLLAVGGNAIGFPGFHGILPMTLLSSGSFFMAIGYGFHRRMLNSMK